MRRRVFCSYVCFFESPRNRAETARTTRPRGRDRGAREASDGRRDAALDERVTVAAHVRPQHRGGRGRGDRGDDGSPRWVPVRRARRGRPRRRNLRARRRRRRRGGDDDDDGGGGRRPGEGRRVRGTSAGTHAEQKLRRFRRRRRLGRRRPPVEASAGDGPAARSRANPPGRETAVPALPGRDARRDRPRRGGVRAREPRRVVLRRRRPRALHDPGAGLAGGVVRVPSDRANNVRPLRSLRSLRRRLPRVRRRRADAVLAPRPNRDDDVRAVGGDADDAAAEGRARRSRADGARRVASHVEGRRGDSARVGRAVARVRGGPCGCLRADGDDRVELRGLGVAPDARRGEGVARVVAAVAGGGKTRGRR